MSRLDELRQKSDDLLNSLNQEIENQDQVKNRAKNREKYKDDRFWAPKLNSEGVAEAIIRFLPPHEDESSSFITYYSYSCKNKETGAFYIEKSLASIGKYDPMAEYNAWLFNQGEQGVQKYKDQNGKRLQNYVSNILVINDVNEPENNGKVFLYKYGKKIMEGKIKPLLNPSKESGESPENPFDIDKGRNFIIKAKKQGIFINYEESTFARSQTPLAKTDEEIEEILSEIKPLKEFIDPANYKSYEELSDRVEKVFGWRKGGENKLKTNTPSEITKQELNLEDAMQNSSNEDDEDVDIDKLIEGLQD